MKIGILGLGNVGLVCAICLAERGHEVTGIEISVKKLNLLKKKKLYIYEEGLKDLFKKNSDKLTFTNKISALKDVENIIVCVGTPSRSDGSVELKQLFSCLKDLKNLKTSHRKVSLMIRSTLLPGTTRTQIIPFLKDSKTRFQVIYCPEFLREGNAVHDFFHPSLCVIGRQKETTDTGHFSDFINHNATHFTSIETAEMIKYLNNSFHALKVAFSNEIATIAGKFDVNLEDLFKIFLSDNVLNISNAYLTPGFAFGGPCLTKELKAINYISTKEKVNLPILKSILESNFEHIQRTVKTIEDLKPRSILLFGAAFKHGTDDLRDSPIIKLIELIQPTSSYLDKIRIFIRDKESVLRKIKRNYFATRKCSEIKEKIDLVIIASYSPTKEDEIWLKQHKPNKIILYPSEKWKSTGSLGIFN
jgi:GDP-mannose 6-dehydrogenase